MVIWCVCCGKIRLRWTINLIHDIQAAHGEDSCYITYKMYYRNERTLHLKERAGSACTDRKWSSASSPAEAHWAAFMFCSLSLRTSLIRFRDSVHSNQEWFSESIHWIFTQRVPTSLCAVVADTCLQQNNYLHVEKSSKITLAQQYK